MPSNWPQIRKQVITRAGGQCERLFGDVRCPNPGGEVHHAMHRDNHSVDALALLCGPCHLEITNEEKAEGIRRTRAKLRPASASRRPPGLL